MNKVSGTDCLKMSFKISLPNDVSKLAHIFGERQGHLPGTNENKELLIKLANDSHSFKGKDEYGNFWHIKIQDDGTQLWVHHRNGVINNGGLNIIPRVWNNHTGLNRNIFFDLIE